MGAAAVLDIIKWGEDSRHQFKRIIDKAGSLAADMVWRSAMEMAEYCLSELMTMAL